MFSNNVIAFEVCNWLIYWYGYINLKFLIININLTNLFWFNLGVKLKLSIDSLLNLNLGCFNVSLSIIKLLLYFFLVFILLK